MLDRSIDRIARGACYIRNDRTIIIGAVSYTHLLNDIAQLAELAHRSGALFHSDATQAFGKMPLSVKQTDVDALSLSSHKIGGPKGVGALFLKTRTLFGAQVVGRCV